MGRVTWCRPDVVPAVCGGSRKDPERGRTFIPDFPLPGSSHGGSAGTGEMGKPTEIWDEGFWEQGITGEVLQRSNTAGKHQSCNSRTVGVGFRDCGIQGLLDPGIMGSRDCRIQGLF